MCLLHPVCTRWVLVGLCLLMALTACAPEPPTTMLPTLPAVLDITPAPTLDIDATATAFAGMTFPTPTSAALYTVQPNDTLSSIAERFNTTVEELVAANGMTDPNNLQSGQTLIIPSLLRTPVVASSSTSGVEPSVSVSPTLAIASPTLITAASTLVAPSPTLAALSPTLVAPSATLATVSPGTPRPTLSTP